MSKFLNKKYWSLKEYTPGEQPQDQQYIKLNTNESPYPPSKSVLDAVNSAEVSKLNLYSDPECKLLKNKLAEIYNVESKNIYVSNGSDDILNFSFMAFCGDEVEALFPEISYGFYKVYADLYGVKYTRVPLKDDFTIDINDYCNQNKFIVIANPNAPTGIALTLDEVEQIVKTNPDNVVLIDEAYVDFGADMSIVLSYFKCKDDYEDELEEEYEDNDMEDEFDENSLDNIDDIAGIRVVCGFIDDIYEVAHMLEIQDDITVIQVKDYIKNPKPNGYRSYHMIIEIPVFFAHRKQNVRVEVQLRTIAMDFWASLEHQMRYKEHQKVKDAKEISIELKQCADIIAETDKKMQDINNKIALIDT
mgnify:CR=1 FL=1